MNVTIEISPGELVDRLTILHIKATQITDKDKLVNVRYETDRTWSAYFALQDEIGLTKSKWVREKYDELKSVNLRIWDHEETIRNIEYDHTFSGDIAWHAIEIAKANDKRAALKKEINVYLDSSLVEEKSHKNL